MSRAEAAKVIRNFISGEGSAYEWDDFETDSHDEVDVDLALRLCWFFAAKFPAHSKSEYCAIEANDYFLKIADLLESGTLAGIPADEARNQLSRGLLPDGLHQYVPNLEETR